MIVTKAVYEHYLKIQAEAAEIKKEVLEPHAKEIACALFHECPNEIDVGFFPDHVGVAGQRDCDYTLDVNLLFDENWRATVEAKLERQRIWYEQRSAQAVEEGEKRKETAERAELARLLAKYPDMAR